MTNRSSRFQRMRRNYAPTDSSFRHHGATLSPPTVEVNRSGRREITAMKSILSFYAYVVFPRRVMRTLRTNRQIRAMFRKENVRITYTEVTAAYNSNFYMKYLLFIRRFSNCFHMIHSVYTQSDIYCLKFYTRFRFLFSKTCFL